MANRAGTFLSDDMMKKHCYGFDAYPLGYALEHAKPNFVNPKLPGIKPPRQRRLPPRPVSVDVKAVMEAQDCCPTRAYAASTVLLEFERQKIIESKKRPVQIKAPLSAIDFQVMGASPQLRNATGLTADQIQEAFENRDQPRMDAITQAYDTLRREEFDQDNYEKVLKGIRQTMTSKPRGDQILEEVRGIKTFFEGARAQAGEAASSSDEAAVANTERSFEAASVRQVREEFRGSPPSAVRQALIAESRSAGTPMAPQLVYNMSDEEVERRLAEMRANLEQAKKTLRERMTYEQMGRSPVVSEFNRLFMGFNEEARKNILQDMILKAKTEPRIATEGVKIADLEREAQGIALRGDVSTFVRYFGQNNLTLPNLYVGSGVGLGGTASVPMTGGAGPSDVPGTPGGYEEFDPTQRPPSPGRATSPRPAESPRRTSGRTRRPT